MFYSALYKKHYPFKRSVDIQALGEKERKTLANYIRRFPNDWSRHLWEIRKKYGKWRYCKYLSCFNAVDLNDFVNEELFKGLADKVRNCHCLGEREIELVNTVLYSHKRNLFWRCLFLLDVRTGH